MTVNKKNNSFSTKNNQLKHELIENIVLYSKMISTKNIHRPERR